MPKFKSYNYDQTMMVPVDLQDQLVPGYLLRRGSCPCGNSEK